MQISIYRALKLIITIGSFQFQLELANNLDDKYVGIESLTCGLPFKFEVNCR